MDYNLSMGLNFFSALSLADVERVHSQVIGWIFHPENNALTVKEKALLLTELFHLPVKRYENILSFTEEEHIDIIIVAETTDGRDVYAIENKLKSSQHSDQLNRYREFIEQDPLHRFVGMSKLHFGYLTLLNEEANAEGWVNLSYEDLANILEILFEDRNSNNANEIILREYIDALSYLVSVIKDFIARPEQYKNVFEEGSLTKFAKRTKKRQIPLTEKQQFIASNQLETPLQKLYLSQIAKNLNVLAKVEIGETRGVAFLQYHFPTQVRFVSVPMHYGIQFQGKSIKINLSAIDYQHSSSEVITDEVVTLFREYLAKSQYDRLNSPRSKGYISISKTLPKNFWEYSLAEIVEIYAAEIETAQKLLSEIKS